MSADRTDPLPQIDWKTLQRIGRELRGLYMVPQDPPPPAMLLALRQIENAEDSLNQLKAAAQALRQAAEPRKPTPAPSPRSSTA
jgi:hypothetical protein